MVRAIISLAATLGMDVVAEGVETQGQADQLLRLGCGLGQGYHLGRPMDISGLAHLLTAPATALVAAPAPAAPVRQHAGAGGRSS